MADQIEITVLAAEAGPGVHALARRVASLGVSVSDVQEAIGVVSGFADADQLERVRALPGVDAVEAAREIQLPPPESDIQ